MQRCRQYIGLLRNEPCTQANVQKAIKAAADDAVAAAADDDATRPDIHETTPWILTDLDDKWL